MDYEQSEENMFHQEMFRACFFDETSIRATAIEGDLSSDVFGNPIQDLWQRFND